ncbi:hypothetical protein [Leptospira kmetyi]|uniref:Uncharacterized protein n=1 Tax=Leptospira kmetyi TaxID=408139 RepID=A0ABX4N723_9LEPT|nr:hypothetical protein [Leptospira kmetyi]PJZ29100.1 hypothetical protein CH378_14535 [Leptospira kmetyi]PJZ39733.1 hypothetical protein CH370_19980 [Leptospira kmetyi]
MDTHSRIQFILSNILIVKTKQKKIPLPVIFYKVAGEEEGYVYAEILNFGILGYGQNVNEAKEDVVELLDSMIVDSIQSKQEFVITPSENEKWELFKSNIKSEDLHRFVFREDVFSEDIQKEKFAPVIEPNKQKDAQFDFAFAS